MADDWDVKTTSQDKNDQALSMEYDKVHEAHLSHIYFAYGDNTSRNEKKIESKPKGIISWIKKHDTKKDCMLARLQLTT